MNSIYFDNDKKMKVLIEDKELDVVVIEDLSNGYVKFLKGVQIDNNELFYNSSVTLCVTKNAMYEVIRKSIKKKIEGVEKAMFDHYYKIPSVYRKLVIKAYELEYGKIGEL